MTIYTGKSKICATAAFDRFILDEAVQVLLSPTQAAADVLVKWGMG